MLVIIGFAVLTYILVSIPFVQNKIKEKAEKELTEFLGGKVEISDIDIIPFNELRLYGVSIYEPEGKRCLSVGRIGAGINLWKLLYSGKIEIAYAELISLNAVIEQKTAGAPLNIDFIIKAFSPKDKNKPPTTFDMKLRNVVIRKSSVIFNRLYKPSNPNERQIDFNHLEFYNIRADLALPVLKNDEFTIDLRRLAFEEKSGLQINDLSFITHITPEILDIKKFNIKFDRTKISISDQNFAIKGFDSILKTLENQNHQIEITASPLIPSEFTAFFPPLADFTQKCDLKIALNGNKNKIDIEEFRFKNIEDISSILLEGYIYNPFISNEIKGNVDRLQLEMSATFLSQIIDIIHTIPEKNRDILHILGDIKIDASGKFDIKQKNLDLIADINTNAGNIDADANATWSSSGLLNSQFALKAEDINLGGIIGNNRLGFLSVNAEGDISIFKRQIEGNIIASVPYIDFNSRRIENINIEAHKENMILDGSLNIDNIFIGLDAKTNCIINEDASQFVFNADINKFMPDIFSSENNIPDVISGVIEGDISGNSIENFSGYVSIKDLNIEGKKSLKLKNFELKSVISEESRAYILDTDFLDGEVRGVFSPEKMIRFMQSLITNTVPTLMKPMEMPDCKGQFAEFDFTIMPDERLTSLVSMPVRPGTPINITGALSGNEETAEITIEAPYLIQGKNKLIKNTLVGIHFKDKMPTLIEATTVMPVKNAMAKLNLETKTADNHSDINLSWEVENNRDNKGSVGFSVDLFRDKNNNNIDISAAIKSSDFMLRGSKWDISPAEIYYSSRELNVEGLRIFNNTQFVDIHGKASDNPLDRLDIELAGIDLEYIFNILNINYVDFGGIATGRAYVSKLFSKAPEARTDKLFVKDLTYNGCLFGDGDLEGHWDNENKMVAINADITGKDDSWAKVRGGVYVTRDSLAFDFKANKVDVGFMHPFVSGFTSSIKGKASGDVKMYGTFSDIDLSGKAVADSVSMLVDYTNVYYTGSDTVFFTPGTISIPSMVLHDKYGNTCHFSGTVNHNYLHDASFNFNVSDVRHLLVYDTSPSIEQNWYGHVFANGSARINGVPGLVTLNMNMSTADNSSFTLVLDENETASNYSFLTFSDHKKQMIEEIEVEETFEDKFYKDFKKEIRERSTLFSMDLALDVTNGANMIIVMDPKAGDKISAKGNGALQFHYDTDIDKFTIYGKYTLANGIYNFSLQELILKNFNIREGSSISFNGDPLQGILDITAAYRVNANLADLDESFKSDPDLNRTAVPVEALLKVTGEIDAPEINFDLSLPTVTSDVERRVRSIVSTEDMMNQQIIYLLALNRFYSPEYTTSSQGGELATVASSTISSQIQNIIGSLTDKFSLAPSFKSDKDNFSDLEVDVALSSSLFDNRLLINGNLGYRDKSTSNTTFIGDFDIEYLLSRDGKLRLKAYNHFNDASYYLRSALTTQGIGIIYRKDFNDPFTFLKRIFRRKEKEEKTPIEKKE